MRFIASWGYFEASDNMFPSVPNLLLECPIKNDLRELA